MRAPTFTRILVPAAAAALLLAACGAGQPARRAWDELDESTGTTLTRVDAPLVFFQDDPARAANARDYIHVAPLGISQGARHGRWLWVALWSTIDRGVMNGEPAVPETTAIRLVADGEPMELDMGAAVASVPGAGRVPYAAPVSTARILFLPLTASQLARVSRATTLELGVARAGEGERPWSLWSGDAAALAEMTAMAGLGAAPGAAGPAPRP